MAGEVIRNGGLKSCKAVGRKDVWSYGMCGDVVWIQVCVTCQAAAWEKGSVWLGGVAEIMLPYLVKGKRLRLGPEAYFRFEAFSAGRRKPLYC